MNNSQAVHKQLFLKEFSHQNKKANMWTLSGVIAYSTLEIVIQWCTMPVLNPHPHLLFYLPRTHLGGHPQFNWPQMGSETIFFIIPISDIQSYVRKVCVSALTCPCDVITLITIELEQRMNKGRFFLQMFSRYVPQQNVPIMWSICRHLTPIFPQLCVLENCPSISCFLPSCICRPVFRLNISFFVSFPVLYIHASIPVFRAILISVTHALWRLLFNVALVGGI